MATFHEELYTVLTGESSITNLVASNNIVFMHLPDNHSVETSALVYEGVISESQWTMDIDNYGDDWSLSIKAVSNSDATVFAIGKAVKDFLETYTSTNYRDVMFETETPIWVEEDNIYVLMMDFKVDYSNT